MKKEWQGIVRVCNDSKDFGLSEHFYLVGTPEVIQLETAISDRVSKGVEDTAVCNCGMAAIGTVLEYLLRPGDKALFSNALYPETIRLANDYQQRKGVQVEFVNPTHLKMLRRLVIDLKPKLYFFELIGNSMQMPVVDYEKTIEALKDTGVVAVVDTTFTPNFHPLLQNNGDVKVIEVASMSKWETSHDAVAGGRISASEEVIAQIQDSFTYRQTVMQPLIAKEIIRRTEKEIGEYYGEICQNALVAAAMLEENFKVKRVYYPRLPSHPQYQLVQRQFQGLAGGVLYVVLENPIKLARFANLLAEDQNSSITPSFGAEDWRIFPLIGRWGEHAPVKGLFRIAAGISSKGFEGLQRALKRL